MCVVCGGGGGGGGGFENSSGAWSDMYRDGLRQQFSPVTGVAGPVPVFRATTPPSYPVHVLVALGGMLSKVDTYTQVRNRDS